MSKYGLEYKVDLTQPFPRCFWSAHLLETTLEKVGTPKMFRGE
jgi:hypothetical protein